MNGLCYSVCARLIGSRPDSRAVKQVVHHAPLALVVPCVPFANMVSPFVRSLPNQGGTQLGGSGDKRGHNLTL